MKRIKFSIEALCFLSTFQAALIESPHIGIRKEYHHGAYRKLPA